MQPSRNVRRLALVVGAALAPVACNLADVFKSPGVEPVVISYTGDTVLTRGTTVPLAIVVLAGGVAVPEPRLSVASMDTTLVGVTPGQDSLIALKIGPDTLTITFFSSMLTDSARTLLQPVRVKP